MLQAQNWVADNSAAVLVFNPQNETLPEELAQWEHDLHKATHQPFAKLLGACPVFLVLTSARRPLGCNGCPGQQ